MGLLDKIKDTIGKATNSSKSMVYHPDCPEIFWKAVKEQLSKHHDLKMSVPKGKGYSIIASKTHKGILQYIIAYSVREGEAYVSWETYHGDDAMAMIETAVGSAAADHIVKQATKSQGKKNKDKWAWSIARKVDVSDSSLLQWYVDTLLSAYEYFESLPEFEQIEKTSQAGKRKITEEGKIIEETPMSLSEKFGILAATMAGMDGSVEESEIEMILGIVQQNSELFDISEVKIALLKELKGIQEYESQSAIVKSINGDDRELIFQSLIVVALADDKLGQDELRFLVGIAMQWEWDWDDCVGMIRMVIENVQEAYGREIDVETV